MNPSNPNSALSVESTYIRDQTASVLGLIVASVGSVVGPFVVITAYIVLSHWPDWVSNWDNSLTFGALSVGVGVICLCFLPITRRARVVLAVVYIPVMSAMLVQYAFWFIDFMFGEYL